MTTTPFTRIAGLMTIAGLLSLPLLLAGCDDSTPKAQAASASESSLADQARQATEARLREMLRGELAFSDMRSYPQGGAESLAICGQVALQGGQPAPFVTVVSRQAGGELAVEPFLPTDRSSAIRVFVESQTRCTEKAAQTAANRPSAPPVLPVIPADLRVLAPPAPPEVARMEAEAAQAQSQPRGAVTMRQNGNLREQPQGQVLRVVPRGAVLNVFAEAPGGWLQVGQNQAEGWMHATMVARNAAPAQASGNLTTAAR